MSSATCKITGAQGRGRLLSVDVLRGLAVLAVLLTHIPRTHSGQLGIQFAIMLPLDFGSLGVPLFLVLSGFCIHLGFARRIVPGQVIRSDWIQFWRRRFYRLYPPYVAAIAFSVAAFYATSFNPVVSAENPIRSLSWDLPVHLLLVQNLTRDYALGLGNPAFWTLGLEEQLYALFAVALLLRNRMSIPRMLTIGLAISLGWRLAVVMASFLLVRFGGIERTDQVFHVGQLALGNWNDWPMGWWFLWLLGALSAEAYVGLVRLPPWCYSWRVVCVCVAFCALTYVRTLGRYTGFWLTDYGSQGWLRAALNCVGSFSEPVFAVACFVVLNAWVRAEAQGRFGGKLVRLLAACGLISYSLYLTHMPTIRLLQAVLPLDGNGLPAFGLRMLIYVPACLAVAAVFFWTVERWFLLHPSRRSTRSRQVGRLTHEGTREVEVVGAALSPVEKKPVSVQDCTAAAVQS